VTCRQIWLYTWKLKDGVLSKTNRGVALKDGRLIRGTPDGYLIVLNIRRGVGEGDER
jgi:alcohol dehydrogenase (cytochrome c)